MPVLSCLVKFTAAHESIGLVIKPHPSANTNLLSHYLSDKNLRNVYVLDKKLLPYHALNCANLLITKFSTLAVEAMMFGCPVISMILDGDNNWQMFDNAVDYLFSIEELSLILNKLVMDNEYRELWIHDHLRRQEHFLSRYFADTRQKTSSELSADAIDEALKEFYKFN